MRIVETEYFDKGQHQKKPNTLTRSEDRNQMDDLSKHTSSVTMTIKDTIGSVPLQTGQLVKR